MCLKGCLLLLAVLFGLMRYITSPPKCCLSEVAWKKKNRNDKEIPDFSGTATLCSFCQLFIALGLYFNVFLDDQKEGSVIVITENHSRMTPEPAQSCGVWKSKGTGGPAWGGDRGWCRAASGWKV